MKAPRCVIWASLMLGFVSIASAEDKADPRAEMSWQSRYQRAAKEYSLFRQPSHDELLKLQPEPAYRWSRAAREGGTGGAIFIWTHEGCAEAVACFWCMRWADGHATIGHELHSLSTETLSVVREGADQWKPTAAFERADSDDAPEPASKPAGRLAQMRSLASEFSGYALSPEGDRQELRRLPTPVYRFAPSNPDVIDGALFAMVCTVGTDPEAFLLIEARQTTDGPRWQFGVARFSHLDLFVSYDGHEVWRAVRGPNDTFGQNASQTYRSFHVHVDESSE